MPSPTTTNFPRPRSWEEFESICADVLKRLWGDPYATRNGRSGQVQHGVDIYGHTKHLGGASSGNYVGAQCKQTDTLNIETIKAEVKKAEEFKPKLMEYIVMTTAPRDAKLQAEVRTQEWPFRVQVVFWEDICLELSGHDDLLHKHFPGWMRKTTTKDQVINLLVSSKPGDFDYDDSTGTFVYSGDVKLRLVINREVESEVKFCEPWATEPFSDPNATQQLIFIYYGGTKVDEVFFAYVDGARYLLPYPKSMSDLTISPFQYQMAQIVSAATAGGYGLDHGLQQAGITVR